MTRAREIAARVRSPVAGSLFVAAKKDKTGEIYLYDFIGVDDWTGSGISPQSVVDTLAEMKGIDQLDVHVNSPGGYVFDGIAIFNAIRTFEGQKTVHVDGIAASIASVIALAGDKVVTNEGAMWMVHDPAGGLFSFGTADQIEDDARKTVQALRKVRENLIDVYMTATGRSLSEVSAWMTGETWMTAQEALDRGFTDEIAKAEPPKEQEEKPAASSVRLSPVVEADLARARVRALSERFSGASPGKNSRPAGKSEVMPE
jgi:ATP-dependent Clp protease protease subunit